MQALIDTSVWIDFFRGDGKATSVRYLISENLVVTNELILAELIPRLKLMNQRKLISRLQDVTCMNLKIDWNEIIQFQTICMKQGINGIGIPDLIIAQNSRQNDCEIYSLDQHFQMLKKPLKLKLLKTNP